MHAFVAALLAVSAAVPPSEKEVGERVRKLVEGSVGGRQSPSTTSAVRLSTEPHLFRVRGLLSRAEITELTVTAG